MCDDAHICSFNVMLVDRKLTATTSCAWEVPSGNLTWLSKITIDIVRVFPFRIAIFHSYVKLPEGNHEQSTNIKAFCWAFMTASGYPVPAHISSTRGCA